MKPELSKIKEIRDSSPAAAIIINSFKDRERDRTTTDVRQYHSRLVLTKGNADVTFEQVLSAYKQLGDIGVGLLHYEDTTKIHRFDWLYRATSIGLALKGKSAEILPMKASTRRVATRRARRVSPPAARPANLATLPNHTHSTGIRAAVRLRPNFVFKFEVPSDFSKDEAKVLADFVISLPAV